MAGNRETDLLQLKLGPRDGEERRRGLKKALRCVIHILQLLMSNVIIVYYKHVLIKMKQFLEIQKEKHSNTFLRFYRLNYCNKYSIFKTLFLVHLTKKRKKHLFIISGGPSFFSNCSWFNPYKSLARRCKVRLSNEHPRYTECEFLIRPFKKHLSDLRLYRISLLNILVIKKFSKRVSETITYDPETQHYYSL